MKEWIVSIVCVVILGILLEIVLPKSKMTKYIKGTFSLLVIFVIVSPLPKLFKHELKFDFSTAWDKVNSAVVQETESARDKEREDDLKAYLALWNYDCEVKIESKNAGLEIESVEIEIYGENANFDEVTGLVTNRLGVEKTQVKLIVRKERIEEAKI